MGCAHRKLRIVLLAAVGLSSSACVRVPADRSSGNTQIDREQPGPAWIKSVFETGALQIEVAAQPNPARLSDEIELIVRVRSTPGIRSEKPRFDDATDDFVSAGFRAELPYVDAGQDVVTWKCALEAKRLGKLSPGDVVVPYVDERIAGERRAAEAVVAVEIDVTSPLNPAEASLESAAKLSGPVAIEAPFQRYWAVVGIAGLSLGLLAAAWIVARRKGRLHLAAGPSPAEIAAQEFDALQQSRWIDTDPKRFYLELTGIVRRYIERTTGIHAPEQTTEEFLRECESNAAVPWTRRDRLRAFLESADLVKFAAVTPLRTAMEESLRLGRRLVDQSATVDETSVEVAAKSIGERA